MLLGDLDHRLSVEGNAPGREFPNHASERVEVSPRTVRLPVSVKLFGRHVRGCAGGGGGSLLIDITCGSRDSKIGQNRAQSVLIRFEKDIGGFEIAVNDAARVRVGERIENIKKHSRKL